jgi:hypothetical protein
MDVEGIRFNGYLQLQFLFVIPCKFFTFPVRIFLLLFLMWKKTEPWWSSKVKTELNDISLSNKNTSGVPLVGCG